MKKVYTTGVFDILHREHINVLSKARGLGDYLVVGIQEDAWVYKSKGRYPVLSTEERVEQVKALPFVDEVLVYKDVNQIPIYKKLKPHIVVQGADWIRTGDRAKMIEYIKNNNIQLVLVPYVEGVSSSDIKRRIVESHERKDRKFILNNVKLFKIRTLDIYELFDEQKTQKLVNKIRREDIFTNPVTVAISGKYKIVIDGVNRLEALRRLGCRFVPALVVNYGDVDLLANVHYTRRGRVTRLSEFGADRGKKIVFPRYTREEIVEMVKNNQKIQNGVTWHKVKTAVIRLKVPLTLLKQKEGFDLEAFLDKKIRENQVRYYASNVYVCDEWE